MKSAVVVLFVLGILLSLTSTATVVAQESFSCTQVSEIPVTDCEALVALYNSTNGPGWTNHTNWLVTNTPSNWYGMTVTVNQVQRIVLSNNNLTGTIPPTIGVFSSLIRIDLSDNSLTSSIPAELGNLSNLTNLYLDNNQLSGGIPSTLGSLTNLMYLDLSDNDLSGPIPLELGNLTELRYLNLARNGLSTNLSVLLNNLTKLTHAILDGNSIAGSIPAWIGDRTTLRQLGLSNTLISGTIPAEIGNLTSLQLLKLDHNLYITGSIPVEFGNLTSLYYLDICCTNLDGGLPASIGNLPNLYFLNINNCGLGGPLPATVLNLSKMEYLLMAGNEFEGEIFPGFGSMTTLKALDLENNKLVGTIPSELGNLPYLQLLHLGGNQLTGDIPASFANLVNLYPPGVYWDGTNGSMDGLSLDFNLLNIPVDYPNGGNPLHTLLDQKDSDWYLNQGFYKVINNSGGFINSYDGKVDISIPSGSFSNEVTFLFTPLPPQWSWFEGPRYVGPAFDLSAKDSFNIPVTQFSLPINVTVTYSDYEIFSFEESTLTLYYWDDAGETWVDAVTTCSGGEYTRNLAENTLSLPVCHLTKFALFGEDERFEVYIPLIRR